MPVTEFAVKEKYEYLEGFGSYHSSEAVKGANPVAINSPQKPPLGLNTERISGTAFTAPRAENQQTWLYRVVSSLEHADFAAHSAPNEQSAADKQLRLTPNAFMWANFPTPPDADFVSSQQLIAQNGDPTAKTGLAYYVFAATKDMPENQAFFSSDGDYLIIPQAGALDIQTELGRLLVRQNEFVVIPRGIRYRVTLPTGLCRGLICELFHGHFKLPELGPIGSTCLANVRDFQIPTAYFDGRVENGVAVVNHPDQQWTIVNRFAGSLFSCTQAHTPFDVVAWNGTYYPYKYDMARFCVLGSVLFDHPDPSIFTVLTAPSHLQAGTAVVDFAIIPPRWAVMEGTYWAPYFHRNCMSEFAFPVINDQSPANPFAQGQRFLPFGALLNNPMVPHGMDKERHEEARNRSTAPAKVDDDGFFLCLLETNSALALSEYALKASGRKMDTVPKL